MKLPKIIIEMDRIFMKLKEDDLLKRLPKETLFDLTKEDGFPIQVIQYKGISFLLNSKSVRNAECFLSTLVKESKKI